MDYPAPVPRAASVAGMRPQQQLCRQQHRQPRSSNSRGGQQPGGSSQDSAASSESRRTGGSGGKCSLFADCSYQYGWMNNKKFIKQLQKDNIDLTVLQSELSSADNRARRTTWKQRLLQCIRSNAAQILLCALVLIDAVLVIAEIILEIKAISSEKRDLEAAFVLTAGFVNRSFAPQLSSRGLLLPEFTEQLRQAPQFAEKLAAGMNSVLLALASNASSGAPAACGHRSRCPNSANRSVPVVASHAVGGGGGGSGGGDGRSLFGSFHYEYSQARVLHTASSVLHCVSIGILALFVIEVALKIVCLGRGFLRDKFEVVDAVVIAISFVADIVFVKLESSEVSVIVLFLLWRIVRVINGLMMHEKQRDEFRIQLQKRARRISEMKCDSLETDRDLQEKHALFLEELCREMGATEDQIANCKPRYVSISKRQSSNALKSMAAMSAGIFGGIAAAQHRRSLNALATGVGGGGGGPAGGTPPGSSRQASSVLDTIAEDAPSSPQKPQPPAADITDAVVVVTNGGAASQCRFYVEAAAEEEAVERKLSCRRHLLMRQQREELDDPWELQQQRPHQISQVQSEQETALLDQRAEPICITEYLAAT